jgi:hypothetical protein
MTLPPEGISQQAWDEAVAAYAGNGVAGEYEHTLYVYERIARAIMAATERATEQAIAACERQKAIFGTNEYATPQPIGGLMERFACDQCIAEIRRNDIPQASNSNFKSVPHMGPVA